MKSEQCVYRDVWSEPPVFIPDVIHVDTTRCMYDEIYERMVIIHDV
jgi:hypothetical protein